MPPFYSNIVLAASWLFQAGCGALLSGAPRFCDKDLFLRMAILAELFLQDVIFCEIKKKLARELLRLRRVASAIKVSTAAWRSSRSVFVS
jgi:hypothetical protein